MQDKIDNLHNLASRLLHIECSDSYLYADDLSQLNQEIHDCINALYPCCGNSMEQEASLCLALLMGYSVCMYASAEDDIKRQNVLDRTQKLLGNLSPSPLKQDLITICNEYASV